MLSAYCPTAFAQKVDLVELPQEESHAPIFASVSWISCDLAYERTCAGGIRSANGEAVGFRRHALMAFDLASEMLRIANDIPNDCPESHWYAIHVMSGREDAVCDEIREQLTLASYSAEYRLLVPKRQLLERHQGEFVEVIRTMFPGYVLVESEDILEFAKAVGRCKGLLRFLRNDGVFQEVQVEEIAIILQMVNDEGIIEISVIEMDEFGSVWVVSGPLKGLEAQICKVDKYRCRVKVAVLFDGERYLIDFAITYKLIGEGV